jgi:hypothetical protein
MSLLAPTTYENLTGSKMRARRFEFCHPISIAFSDTGRGCWDRIRGGENADFGIPALCDSVCLLSPFRSKIQCVFLFGCFVIMVHLVISLVADCYA